MYEKPEILVRINAQLIDAVTGGHVWAERYDDSAEDIFALQDRITKKIVNALELNLIARQSNLLIEAPQAPKPMTHSCAAGRIFGATHPEAFAKAVPYFEQAIEFDSNYSLAHAALATVYWKVLDKSFSTRNDAWVAFQKISWEVATKRFTDNLNSAMERPGGACLPGDGVQVQHAGPS